MSKIFADHAIQSVSRWLLEIDNPGDAADYLERVHMGVEEMISDVYDTIHQDDKETEEQEKDLAADEVHRDKKGDALFRVNYVEDLELVRHPGEGYSEHRVKEPDE